MVQLRPIRAWHPNPEQTTPDSLVCPVYDTLTEEDFQRFGHLTHNAAGFVPRPPKVPLDRFLTDARKNLQQAMAARAFVRDPSSAYYVYGIRYVPPSDVREMIPERQRRAQYLLLGLVGVLELTGSGPNDIALHEHVFSDRVDERVALAEATGMNFAPIMAGYTMPDHALNDRLENLLGLNRRRLSFHSSSPPVVEAHLSATTHLLWRIDDPGSINEIGSMVSSLRILVLDGHHRFSAALARHRLGRASFPLVMLVENSDRALHLLPWHRTLRQGDLRVEEWFRSAGREFDEVSALPPDLSPEAAVAELHEMARRRQRGFLAISGTTALKVQGPASNDAGADFDLLHSSIEGRWGTDPHRFAYHRSPRLALDTIRMDGENRAGGIAFLLPSLSTEGVERRAFDTGTMMARKSTMFLPKVAEGVLLAAADGK